MGFGHNSERLMLHDPKVGEYSAEIPALYTNHRSRGRDGGVVKAGGPALPQAPLGAHGFEEEKGLPAVGPYLDLFLFNVVLR